MYCSIFILHELIYTCFRCKTYDNSTVFQIKKAKHKYWDQELAEVTSHITLFYLLLLFWLHDTTKESTIG
jgi:hypothetical protein